MSTTSDRTSAPADGDTGRTRATALPPDERRAAIIAATVPLLLSEGANVTTRQIAEAAGIAEGTIFRVFPDKDTLIEAVVEMVMDPGPTEAELAAIDRALPLRDRLLVATEILQRRVTRIWALNDAVGLSRPSKRRESRLSGVAAVIEPDRDLLRTDPLTAAQALVGLTFAGTHPALGGVETLSPDQIVSLLLDGIADQPPSATTRSATAPPKTSRNA